MNDIVERLRIYATDDHERGCQGRCYDCSCGYDDKRDPLLKEAADEIERLRLLLEMSHKKFATLKAAYDMEMRKPIVLCGSAAPGGDA